ncbi:MAG: deoxyribose-phosphate aldolase [Bacteroidales bacterium]|nr:deoxyribose-phosphate aldolase [Bacteroidales bacterium]
MHFNTYNTTLNELGQRAKEISKKTFDAQEELHALKTILSVIDLTTLSGDDTYKKVNNLCEQAINFKNNDLETPQTAAICVYPVFAKQVSEKLEGTGIQTACVAGAFPSGQSPLSLRIEEVKFTVEQGADEIDMVISRGKLIEGDEDFIFNEVAETKKACGNKHLKVILETGELKSVELIRKASEISILAGGDFIKTSTGKIDPAATPEAFLIMLDTIKEFYEKTGKKIGIKPAGGIAEVGDAMHYYKMVQEVLGNEWLNNKLFRIGASRLASKVFEKIKSISNN